MGWFDQEHHSPIRGRGTPVNPPNRWEPLYYEQDPTDGAPQTRFFKDPSRSILSYNESPDVGFEVSLNPYRGCEHGCIYCYARPTHEYLGFSCGLDFETKILVKEKAPELLRRELSSPRWKPQAIALSGVTDPYQPIERHLKLTRRCLKVLVEFCNPVVVVTKSALVTRDLDFLQELARYGASAVFLSVTTLRGELSRTLEPRAPQPSLRLAAIETLAKAGVPVGVLIAPVIPGLTDQEIPSILKVASRAGARFAGYGLLRLPHGVGTLFEHWLAQYLPERKGKVLSRLRSLYGGRLSDARFGVRRKGQGNFAEQIEMLFFLSCRREGLKERGPKLSSASFRKPSGVQLLLFE